MANLTQQERIVAIMCMNKQQKWWKPQDIMKTGQGELFVGYEASARLSELASDYPEMVESKREGKFYLRRMRFETGREWFPGIPKNFQNIIRRYYRKPGTEYDH